VTAVVAAEAGGSGGPADHCAGAAGGTALTAQGEVQQWRCVRLHAQLEGGCLGRDAACALSLLSRCLTGNSEECFALQVPSCLMYVGCVSFRNGGALVWSWPAWNVSIKWDSAKKADRRFLSLLHVAT